jgi:prevent-host-death family protein
MPVMTGHGLTGGATLCYVRTVTHREMRNNSGEILRAVAAGETVQVTNNGQVAAVISPPDLSPLERLLASQAVRPAQSGAAALRTIKRAKSRRSTREILEDVRGRW